MIPMLIPRRGSLALTKMTLVGSTQSNANSAARTMPAGIQAGDLIVAIQTYHRYDGSGSSFPGQLAAGGTGFTVHYANSATYRDSWDVPTGGRGGTVTQHRSTRYGILISSKIAVAGDSGASIGGFATVSAQDRIACSIVVFRGPVTSVAWTLGGWSAPGTDPVAASAIVNGRPNRTVAILSSQDARNVTGSSSYAATAVASSYTGPAPDYFWDDSGATATDTRVVSQAPTATNVTTDCATANSFNLAGYLEVT